MPDFYWRRPGGGAHMRENGFQVEFLETASQIPMAYGTPAFNLRPRAVGGTKLSINPASKTSSPFFML